MKPREFLQVDPASLGTFSGEGVRRGQLCATAVSAVGDRSRARNEGYAHTADTAVAHELSAPLPFLATTLRKSPRAFRNGGRERAVIYCPCRGEPPTLSPFPSPHALPGS